MEIDAPCPVSFVLEWNTDPVPVLREIIEAPRLLSALEFVLSILVIVFGSTVMSLVSFGLGMVLSPFLLFMLDPVSVVMTINTLTVLILGITLARSRQDVSIKDVTPLALGGLFGAPVGVFILSSADSGVLRVAIAGIILALVIPSALRVQRPFSRPNLISPLVGFSGSMLVTGMGVGTPLVVLYLVNQALPVRKIRASIALYSTVVAIAAIILYAVTGLYTMERVWLILRFIPAVLLGVALATVLGQRIDDRMLRRLILAVVIVASLALLGREGFRL